MTAGPTKILLVEDNRADAVLLQDMLLNASPGLFDLSREDRLNAALERLANDRFDAILLDLTLPDSHGLATLDRIQKVAGTVPTIILTGIADEEIAMRAIRHGAQDYLVKGSVDGRAIAKAIRYAIDRKKTEESLRRSEAAYAAAKASLDSEKKLRTSQATLAEAQHIAHIGNWDWDIVTHALEWSDEIYRIFGLTPQTFGATYDAFLKRVHPDDRNFVRNSVNQALEKEQPYSLDHRIVRPDGSERIVHEQAEVFRDEAGRPVRMLGIVQDVTEHREAENRDRIISAFLALFARKSARKEYLDAVVKLLRHASRCHGVGIRVVNAAGFIPYESSIGFDDEFLKKESMLCLRADVCACIRVAMGRPEPQDMPMMTPAGSFCCNHSTAFVGSLTDDEAARFRGNCVKNGYLSIGIIPVRHRDNILGVIHLADPRQDAIPPAAMAFMEVLAPLIGEALFRFQVEETLRESESRYQDELRAMSFRLSLAEERARRELAVALHDTVGQTLALSKIKMGALGQLLTTSDSRKELLEIRQMFEEAIRQTRTLSFELSPPILYELGLDAALEWLGEEFQRRHGFQFHFEGTGSGGAIPESVSVLMFQSVRELLVNVGKHAAAGHVHVVSRAGDGQLIITVRDDGKGFDPEMASAALARKNSLGLFSIRERMRHIGGSFTVDSTPGQGTTMTLSVPLEGGGGGEVISDQ